MQTISYRKFITARSTNGNRKTSVQPASVINLDSTWTADKSDVLEISVNTPSIDAALLHNPPSRPVVER
jgi:hypothetical protein